MLGFLLMFTGILLGKRLYGKYLIESKTRVICKNIRELDTLDDTLNIIIVCIVCSVLLFLLGLTLVLI